MITRPVGNADPLARRVRACGGVPLRLPGLALRFAEDAEAACRQLQQALGDEVLVFTSPAAVRFAARLAPLRSRGAIFAVGEGTAQALRREGLAAQVPLQRQDSEGLLDLPALRHLQGRRVSLIGAAGGRGVLREQLVARGARLREVHVYRRQPARLDRRHLAAIARLPASGIVLWSSGEALRNLQHVLPPGHWRQLCQASAVVSSGRLAQLAREAGFERIAVATSALPADLLQAAAGLVTPP